MSAQLKSESFLHKVLLTLQTVPLNFNQVCLDEPSLDVAFFSCKYNADKQLVRI